MPVTPNQQQSGRYATDLRAVVLRCSLDHSRSEISSPEIIRDRGSRTEDRRPQTQDMGACSSAPLPRTDDLEPRGPPVASRHDGLAEPEPPQACWTRSFDAPPIDRSRHKPSKPGVVEIIGLLPIAVSRFGLLVNAPLSIRRMIKRSEFQGACWIVYPQ